MKRYIKIFTGRKITELENKANEFAEVRADVEIVSANIAFIDSMGNAALAVVYEKSAKRPKAEKK